jgi:DNA-binding NarL/FixJ family response regulator
MGRGRQEQCADRGDLGASPRTIAKHLERIYEKLGVESRTAAAMRAVRR